MFTGIVEGLGHLRKKTALKSGVRLAVEAPFSLATTKKGDSIAVNGCCLTVISTHGKSFEADLSHETLQVTCLQDLKAGDLVNLERPVRLSDRLGGHLVQGHVDGIGKILGLRQKGISREIVIGLSKVLRRYLILKGSITVNGISMTVNGLSAGSFTLVVIPHTLKATNLKAYRVGERVNLEVDMVGKYIESLAGKRKKS